MTQVGGRVPGYHQIATGSSLDRVYSRPLGWQSFSWIPIIGEILVCYFMKEKVQWFRSIIRLFASCVVIALIILDVRNRKREHPGLAALDAISSDPVSEESAALAALLGQSLLPPAKKIKEQMAEQLAAAEKLEKESQALVESAKKLLTQLTSSEIATQVKNLQTISQQMWDDPRVKLPIEKREALFLDLKAMDEMAQEVRKIEKNGCLEVDQLKEEYRGEVGFLLALLNRCGVDGLPVIYQAFLEPKDELILVLTMIDTLKDQAADKRYAACPCPDNPLFQAAVFWVAIAMKGCLKDQNSLPQSLRSDRALMLMLALLQPGWAFEKTAENVSLITILLAQSYQLQKLEAYKIPSQLLSRELALAAWMKFKEAEAVCPGDQKKDRFPHSLSLLLADEVGLLAQSKIAYGG